MLVAILLLLLAALAAMVVPFADFTSTKCCEGDADPWQSFRKSLRTYAIIVIATLLYASILFLYGASNEATWTLAFISMLIAPFSLVSSLLYGFWWLHLDTRHPTTRQPDPAP